MVRRYGCLTTLQQKHMPRSLVSRIWYWSADPSLSIGMHPPAITFRDAAFCVSTFGMTILDCALALHRAASLGHFRYADFNVKQYQDMNKLQHGDLTWIVPGKLIAFSGPIAKYVTSTIG